MKDIVHSEKKSTDLEYIVVYQGSGVSIKSHHPRTGKTMHPFPLNR